MELELLEVKPNKKKQFEAKGIRTIEDLLQYIPRAYKDYRHLTGIYNHAVTISKLPSAAKEEIQAFSDIWEEQMSFKKTDEIGLGFMAPPGTSYPTSFNDEEGIAKSLNDFLSSSKSPSEFFSSKEFPNCCQSNCEDCSSKDGCCLLAVGRVMKGIQEKQKKFVAQSEGRKKRGEIA